MYKWIHGVTLLLFAALLKAQGPAARIGIYHWGGQHSHSMNEGVDAIAALGGHVARVALSARYYRDYNIGQECYPRFSLTEAARQQDVARAFDNPAIDVFVVTAYDGVTFGDCETQLFLNPDFYTAATSAALIQEYSDFTLHLYQTHRSTHKRFIISNWEADNTVYCGQAYVFATDAAFRSACLAQYQHLYGVASPEDALSGLKLWFDARAEGIQDGRRRALAQGIGGMRVYMAPEFNMVRVLRESGFKSVLYDILPFIAFDYVSYSSYESINAADPAAALRGDLAVIQNIVGSSAIIVGEAGFSRRLSNGQDVDRTRAVLAAALEWGVPYAIQWQLYDSQPSGDFGLYDLDGQPTALANWFRDCFHDSNTVLK